MELKNLKKQSDYQWLIEPTGKMRVPAIIYADETLIKEMEASIAEADKFITAMAGS